MNFGPKKLKYSELLGENVWLRYKLNSTEKEATKYFLLANNSGQI